MSWTVNPFTSRIKVETCSVVLTFESVDKILPCNHSNATSLEVLLHGTNIFSIFSIFYKMKLRFLVEFDVWYSWE